jgi:hypothetical protein
MACFQNVIVEMARSIRDAHLAGEDTHIHLPDFQPPTGDENKTKNLETAFEIMKRLSIRIPTGTKAVLMNPAARTAENITAAKHLLGNLIVQRTTLG